MKTLVCLVLLASLYFSAPAAVGQSVSPYAKKEFVDKAGNVLPYRILYPKNYDKKKKYPLVVFLHGAGERGNDNEKQLTHGSKLFVERQDEYPAIVIFPQCPENNFWGSVAINRGSTPASFDFDYQKYPIKWPLQAVLDLVKQMQKTESLDKNRLYIMGLSMGGMGTFEAIAREPKRFAAAMPICGGGDVTSVTAYAKRLPLWVFHGAADAVVGVEESRRMVRALEAAKADVKYTEYPGVNHNSWDNAFSEPDYLAWLFAKSKKR